ncbi:MAG: quinolinate synthase NadA [Acidobacteria bacterium]|nr:quinolinate synthase NadA [Acidobacteriota bacterium]
MPENAVLDKERLTGFIDEEFALAEEILELKKERNAVILAHNYQVPQVQLIGDYLGDSFDLSKRAAQTTADTIVFCGVFFMAESAKILSPSKIVLLPELSARCSLADSIEAEDVRKMKAKHPNAVVVTYINSSAEVKAESDVCCTSANALKVVESLDEDEILMIPDINLANWVEKQTSKKIIKWNGACHVHHRLTAKEIMDAKKLAPNAPVIAHPECREEILELSDYILGTSGMLKLAKEIKDEELIIATELGLVQRMQRENPDKKIYPVTVRMICEYMKETTLESVRDALKMEQHKIDVPEEIRVKAYKSLDRMLSVIG